MLAWGARPPDSRRFLAAYGLWPTVHGEAGCAVCDNATAAARPICPRSGGRIDVFNSLALAPRDHGHTTKKKREKGQSVLLL